MFATIPLLLSSSVIAATQGDPALVIDIGRADAAYVESLKHGESVRWWVELGDRLVLAGDRVALRDLAKTSPLLAEVDDLTPQQLALRARGCKEHGDAIVGTLIARGGRWELRRLNANESLPVPRGDGDEGEWRSVQANSILARQYRLDAATVAPADPLVQPIVDAIDSARWFADVQTLAGWDRSSYGTTSLTQARDWIGSQFTALGLTLSTPIFNMPGPGGSGQITRSNVIGTWTGTSKPDEWIIVGGHYDSRNASLSSTLNAPGADDNASGCVATIELARVLTAFRPQRSILFMCYAGEEQGLYGSKAHVQALQQSGDFIKVQSVVIMDMIGYSADSQLDVLFESSVANSAYLQRFAAAAATYVPALNVSISTNPFGSDHIPYINAGKQTLLVIEGDWDSYPYYHTSSDLPQNIGPNTQAMGGAILKTDAAMLAQLSGASDRIFADGGESVP
jgi:Peptidase family M28